MKKAISILLLLVFLFNVGGYYIVFWGLRYQTDQKLTYRLNTDQYDPSETIEIKIPVTLPYPIQDRDFERVDGRFEHNGEHFKLVKHKLQNDTLYVVCLRDQETRQLVTTLTDYVHLTQALPGADTSQKALHFLSKLIKDFYSHSNVSVLHQSGYIMDMLFNETPARLLQAVIPVLAPPPRI